MRWSRSLPTNRWVVCGGGTRRILPRSSLVVATAPAALQQILDATQLALLPQVAVLKWCVFQTRQGRHALTLDGRDMRVLIDLKLPIELSDQVGGAKKEVVLPIIKQLDGVGYPDFVYGQVALREFLLHAGAGEMLVNYVPGPRPFKDYASVMRSATMPPGQLPNEPLGAAMMEFLCHVDVRAHGLKCAELRQRLLVTHPFALHIQVSPAIRDVLLADAAAWLTSVSPRSETIVPRGGLAFSTHPG